MDKLTAIIEVKRKRLAESKLIIPLEQLRPQAIAARSNSEPHRLLKALGNDGRTNIIAEIKRASPSRGVIRGNIDPAAMATAYQTGGAAAISVLTEEDHFGGSLDDLRNVRGAVRLPLLRKDFIFDAYQIYESAAAGADALLLIVAALDDETLGHLRRIAEDELGIDALIEVHNSDELERASKSGARVIGVNNRDLRTFEVSMKTSADLASLARGGVTLVSESGIKSRQDIQSLRALGYRGFLIGEHLMRADDPEEELRALVSVD